MRQSFLLVASAVVVAVSLPASPAVACISCEYVPSVVNSGTKGSSSSTSYQARSHSRPRAIDSARERRTKVTRQRSKQRDTVTKTAAPAVDPPAKPSSVASTTNEHSTISAATPITTTPAVATTAALPPAGDTEHSSIAGSDGAHSQRAEASTMQVDSGVSASVGCKKFFPSVGLTLSVPCE